MKVGDILVRTEHHPDNAIRIGDMTEMVKDLYKNKGQILITPRSPSRSLYCKDKFRLATEKEIYAYKQGITKIQDIPEDFQVSFIPLIFN